jgi:hypothetical protein
MKRRTGLTATGCTIAAALAVFTGAAAAGTGKGHAQGDHGQSGSPSETHSSTQAQSSQQSHDSESHAAKNESHGSTEQSHATTNESHAAKHTAADGSKKYGNGKSALEIAHQNAPTITSPSQLSGPGNSGLHKVTICHKTGHGYVVITVDVHSLKNGHTAAKGDVIPAPAGGCPTVAASESSPQSTEETKTETRTQTHETEHKVTICHATGSATNPYVEITVDEHSLKNGHTAAKGDIIPAPASGCPTAAPTQGATAGEQEQQEQSSCGTTTRTETVQVVDGIWHHTGSKTNPYVLIHPSSNSAHWTKHEDDIPNVVTETRTVTVAGSDESCESSQQQNTAAATQEQATTQEQQTTTTSGEEAAQTTTTTTETPTISTVAAAQNTQTRPANQSGVAGAQKTLRNAASPAATPARGGVLGAVHTLTSATLPFTGFPIWAAVLAALLAIGIGVMFNRVGTARR